MPNVFWKKTLAQYCYLVSCIDIGVDSGPTRFKHIWGAQRCGGHRCTTLQPAVFFQIREFETPLWIYCKQALKQEQGFKIDRETAKRTRSNGHRQNQLTCKKGGCGLIISIALQRPYRQCLLHRNCALLQGTKKVKPANKNISHTFNKFFGIF